MPASALAKNYQKLALMGKKILSIIFTYYPERELLANNVSNFINDVDKVLIWENTPKQLREQYRFIKHSKVEYVHGECNSISLALNYAWKYAVDYGFDYLLTMDQDSIFENFPAYKKEALILLEKNNCIIGPSINKKSFTIGMDVYSEKDTIITSGMIVPISTVEKVGGWCKEFIVDGIDIDFCLNVASKGYHIFQMNSHCLIQRFGSPETRCFLGKTIILHNYNPKRLHDYARNLLIVLRKYDFPTELARRYFKALRNTIFNIFFFESQKTLKLYNLCIGFIEGLKFKIKKSN